MAAVFEEAGVFRVLCVAAGLEVLAVPDVVDEGEVVHAPNNRIAAAINENTIRYFVFNI